MANEQCPDLKEQCRLLEMLQYETRLKEEGYSRIAGVDEAGRGPLAGPVVAAACILPPNRQFIGLNDSKKISEKTRDELYEQLLSDPDVLFGVGIVSAERIDQINILQATFEAMVQAVEAIVCSPDYLLIDGNRCPAISIPSLAIVKGDSRSQSIAAASILAKVTRDRIMKEEAKRFPQYGFEKHKGYGTAAHLNALRIHGASPIHRKSFVPNTHNDKGLNHVS